MALSEEVQTIVQSYQKGIENYWKDKPYKSWVVTLESGRKKSSETDVMFVRASNQSSAIRIAKKKTLLKRKVRCRSIRLMGPFDACCYF